MSNLEIPAIITEVKTAPDGGVRLKIDVNELTPEALYQLFSLKGEFLAITLKPNG